MFRRKEDGSDTLVEDNVTEIPAEAETVRSVAANDSVRPVPVMPAQTSYRPAAPSAAMAAMRPVAPAATQASAPQPAPALKSSNTKRVLTVGPDIQMKGEITTCDRVVIEGVVDATMKDVHTVELAQSGSLKGTAEVEDAEISGVFEGDLVVRGRLIIYSTGRVSGNITYGEIEIERGGQLSGSIRTVKEAGAKGAAPKRVA